MSGSSLKSFVLPAVLLSSTVFATLTLPLAVLGSKPIDIRMQSEPVFSGQVRDIAAPYLGFAAALSLGAGVASIAVTGWKRSSRKSSQMEEALSLVKEELQTKEGQLETLKLSETQLAASGLTGFLQGQATVQQPTFVDATPAIAPTPVTVFTPEPHSAPVVAAQVAQAEVAHAKAAVVETAPAIAPAPVVAKSAAVASASLHPVSQQRVNVQAAVSALSPAQAFLSFAQVGSAPEEPAVPDAVSQFDALQTQLKQMMAQIELLQGALQPPAQGVTRPHHAVKSRYGHQHLHTVEALPVPQKVAS